MLTQFVLTNAKPKTKAYKLADSDGRHLLVKPSGARLWRFRYRFASKGRLPEICVNADWDQPHRVVMRELKDSIRTVAARLFLEPSRRLSRAIGDWRGRHASSKAFAFANILLGDRRTFIVPNGPRGC